MSSWSEQLNSLATEYHRRLSTGELNRRLSHHLCHVASELWLAGELAYLVNEDGGKVDLKDWNALLENQRVDVTLIPPSNIQNTDPIFLELKLVPPDFWSNWYEVFHDLACHPEKTARKGKPQGHFAICFLVDAISNSTGTRRSETTERYRQFVARIPGEPGPFQPIEGFPSLWLQHCSSPIRVNWPHPVYGKWPDGYEANVRILWVSARV